MQEVLLRQRSEDALSTMKVTDLTNNLRVLLSKQKKGESALNFKFRVNSYSHRILKKLQAMGFMKDLKKLKKGYVCVQPVDLLDLKFYRHPYVVFSYKNYPKIYATEIQNDEFTTLLVSTSEYGILSLKETLEKRTGGYVIGKVVAKVRCLEK